MTRTRRTSALTLAFVLAACGTQALVTPSGTPSAPASPTATASPRPTNAIRDVVYVRGATPSPQGGVSPAMGITVLDARTGESQRRMPSGVVSADRALLFSTESIKGATQTIVHVTDLKKGTEVRSVTVDGDLALANGYDANSSPLTPDGRWLALWHQPFKIDAQWINTFAVVDTVTGSARRTGVLKGDVTYGFVGLGTGGRDIYLWQFGNGETRLRAFDLDTNTFVDVTGWNGGRSVAGFQGGYRSAFVRQGDRMYALDAGGKERPGVLAIDLPTRSAVRIPLPDEQKTDDFEKYMLWSLALAGDGHALYAVNPAIGVADEVDVSQMTVRRTARLVSARPDSGLLARLSQLLFPIADAKRYLRGNAALSPDGRTLYAIGNKGIAVVDTTTLALRSTWAPQAMIGSIALTPDGARLYGIDDGAHAIVILDARDGSSLGHLETAAYESDIIRIEVP